MEEHNIEKNIAEKLGKEIEQKIGNQIGRKRRKNIGKRISEKIWEKTGKNIRENIGISDADLCVSTLASKGTNEEIKKPPSIRFS